MSFVDRVDVTLKAGDGGNGIVSFRHEKFRPLGGPDGGNGGNGGDVVLVASNRENTLANFRYKKEIKAEGGKPGVSRKRHGRNAEDLEVPVPVGTVVTTDGKQIADLSQEGAKAIVAKGGKGGFGNAHFISSTRQAPRVAEKGEKGEVINATLELKMIADVGIVGLPNAGKSTLLSVISHARPTIADYPFTTLVPNLGVADIDNKHSLLFADIPGLIEGASTGKGLGDEFLRHVERTGVLLHLIDYYSHNLAKDYKTIIKELKDYKVDLSKRPQVVAVTKIEGVDKKELRDKMATLARVLPKNTPLVAISSKSGNGIRELLRSVLKQLSVANKPSEKLKEAGLPVIGLKENDDDWMIEKTPQGFLVKGSNIERFARRTNFGDYHGEQRLRDIMQKMGIVGELDRRGAEPGEKISFGMPEIGSLEY